MPGGRPALLSLLAFLPAACGPIIQLGGASGPPPAQHVLSPAPAAAAAGKAADGPIDPAHGVTLLSLSAHSMLKTPRIPVRVGETEIRYIVGHAWAEPPARLFGRRVSEQLVAYGIPLVDRQVTGRSAGHVLGGELAEFGVDARQAPVVRIRLEATLAGPDGVRRRSFAREARLARIEGGDAAAALDALSADLSADLALWVAAALRRAPPRPAP